MHGRTVAMEFEDCSFDPIVLPLVGRNWVTQGLCHSGLSLSQIKDNRDDSEDVRGLPQQSDAVPFSSHLRTLFTRHEGDKHAADTVPHSCVLPVGEAGAGGFSTGQQTVWWSEVLVLGEQTRGRPGRAGMG